jgi:hypothetical protein
MIMENLEGESTIAKEVIDPDKPVKSRNGLLLRIVCAFAITYYGLATIVLFVVLVFNEFITDMSKQYLPDMELSRLQLFLFILAGLLMNLGAVLGSSLVLFKKRNGISVFVLSSVLIIIYQYVLSGPDGWQKYVVELGVLLFFLLILPSNFKKMQPKAA